MAFENEALALPALSPELAVQGLGDWTLPIELDNPVVEDNALELRPFAEAATALVVHESVFNHLKRCVFNEAQWRTQIDSFVDVGSLKVC